MAASMVVPWPARAYFSHISGMAGGRPAVLRTWVLPGVASFTINDVLRRVVDLRAFRVVRLRSARSFGREPRAARGRRLTRAEVRRRDMRRELAETFMVGGIGSGWGVVSHVPEIAALEPRVERV